MFFLAETLLMALAAYLAAGVAFALAFAAWGVQAIDPAAKGMPMPARLLMLPGATALWPVLLLRWLRGLRPPVA